MWAWRKVMTCYILKSTWMFCIYYVEGGSRVECRDNLQALVHPLPSGFQGWVQFFRLADKYLHSVLIIQVTPLSCSNFYVDMHVENLSWCRKTQGLQSKSCLGLWEGHTWAISRSRISFPIVLCVWRFVADTILLILGGYWLELTPSSYYSKLCANS